MERNFAGTAVKQTLVNLSTRAAAAGAGAASLTLSVCSAAAGAGAASLTLSFCAGSSTSMCKNWFLNAAIKTK